MKSLIWLAVFALVCIVQASALPAETDVSQNTLTSVDGSLFDGETIEQEPSIKALQSVIKNYEKKYTLLLDSTKQILKSIERADPMHPHYEIRNEFTRFNLALNQYKTMSKRLQRSLHKYQELAQQTIGSIVFEGSTSHVPVKEYQHLLKKSYAVAEAIREREMRMIQFFNRVNKRLMETAEWKGFITAKEEDVFSLPRPGVRPATPEETGSILEQHKEEPVEKVSKFGKMFQWLKTILE